MDRARAIASANVQLLDTLGSSHREVSCKGSYSCSLFVGTHDPANAASACLFVHVTLEHDPSCDRDGSAAGSAAGEYLLVFDVNGRYCDARERFAAALPYSVRSAKV